VCLITVLPYPFPGPDPTSIHEGNKRMSILTDDREVVIGVDTHKNTHTAAVIDPTTSTVLATYTIATTPAGYHDLIESANSHGKVKVWAIEGTRTYGVGLVRMLLACGQIVSEADRPKRPSRRGGKNDEIDSIRAGREACGHQRIAQPRHGSHRDAIAAYLCVRHSAVEACAIAQTQLKALIVTSPDEIRSEVRDRTPAATWHACTQLATVADAPIENEAIVAALVTLASRIISLHAEANKIERLIEQHVKAWKPELLNRRGVGVITAAHLLCAWSHPGRFHSEAAFAMLAGVAPIPASSGQTIRYRLNRRGDRQLNKALYIITTARLRHDDTTKAYAARRVAEGKTHAEIKRCLKRYVARELFRLLEHPTHS
jgi:transposase